MDDKTLREIMSKFLLEIERGLKKKTHPEADIKCFVTYVQDLPNGKGETKPESKCLLTMTNKYATTQQNAANSWHSTWAAQISASCSSTSRARATSKCNQKSTPSHRVLCLVPVHNCLITLPNAWRISSR